MNNTLTSSKKEKETEKKKLTHRKSSTLPDIQTFYK